MNILNRPSLDRLTLPDRDAPIAERLVVYAAMSMLVLLLGAAALLLVVTYSRPHTLYVASLLVVLTVCVVVLLYLREAHKSSFSLLLLATWSALLTLQTAFLPDPVILSRAEKTVLERRNGRSAYPLIHPQNFLAGISDFYLQKPKVGDRAYLPLASLPDVRSVYCKDDGPWTIFRTDSLGFRNPVPGTGTVPMEERQTLLAIGDSYVEGACVRSDEQLLAHLEGDTFSTLNLGRGGAGPLTKYAILREYGEEFDPDVVLWVHFEGNDLLRRDPGRPSDLSLELQSQVLSAYLEDSSYTQRLQTVMTRLAPLLKSRLDSLLATRIKSRKVRYKDTPLIQLADRLVLLPVAEITAGFVRALNRSSLEGESAAVRRSDSLPLLPFERVLRAAADQTSALGAQLVFVVLPDKISCVRDEAHPLHESVLASVEEAGVASVDLWPMVQNDCEADWYSTTGPHLSPLGYRRVGEYLASRLGRMIGSSR